MVPQLIPQLVPQQMARLRKLVGKHLPEWTLFYTYCSLPCSEWISNNHCIHENNRQHANPLADTAAPLQPF